MRTAIVLGTFDGLHTGHRAVLDSAKGFHTVAVTFDMPPKAFFGDSCGLLMTPEDKAAGLKTLGVSKIMTLDFGKIFNMPPEEFFDFLKKKFTPSLIVCGFNYRFGRGAGGNVELLSSLCKESRIGFKCVDCVGNGAPVSSSALRTMIANGDVKGANRQIFGGFGFTSEVIHGDSRGSAFGFPTMNQKFPDILVKPRFGVYKSRVYIDGREYESITNIGVRPTFQTDFTGCETFAKGFDGRAYGKKVTLKFDDFIREEEKFSTVEALCLAVAADIKNALGVEI